MATICAETTSNKVAGTRSAKSETTEVLKKYEYPRSSRTTFHR